MTRKGITGLACHGLEQQVDKQKICPLVNGDKERDDWTSMPWFGNSKLTSKSDFLMCSTDPDAYTSLPLKAVPGDMDMCSIHLLVGLYLHIVLCTSLLFAAHEPNDGLTWWTWSLV